MARELAKNPTVLIVNDTLFAHGGVLKRHGTSLYIVAFLACACCAHLGWLKLCDCIAVQYGLEKMNQEVSSWMRGLHNADGSRPTPPFFATGSELLRWKRVVAVFTCFSILTLVAAFLGTVGSCVCISHDMRLPCVHDTKLAAPICYVQLTCMTVAEHTLAVLDDEIANKQSDDMACRDASSVMWNRMYSKEAFTPYDRFCVCRQLKATLEATGARHMIIGHTPQVRTTNLCIQMPHTLNHFAFKLFSGGCCWLESTFEPLL